VDIVMLGHSAAGKSSYMALMYELMFQGVNGFTVTAEQDLVHYQLIHAARAIRTGSYPDPTDRRSSYQLRLRHRQSSVIEFVWKDFRGNALMEYSTSEQQQEPHRDLQSADGIVLFVDLPELLTDAYAQQKVRFLTVLITDALGERTRPTPLVIACTKSDLVQPWMDPAPFVSAFTPMIDAVAASVHIHGTLVKLSCGPAPEGIQGPVLFCLALGLAARAQQLRDAHTASVELARFAERNDTLWDRISSPFKNESTWRSIAISRHAEANGELHALEALVEPGKCLLDEIDDLPRF